MSPKPIPTQGLLPSEVHAIILKREWHNLSHLKARLNGSKPFPIKIPLKPYSGKQALEQFAEFKHFIEQWEGYPQQAFVRWEVRTYRQLSSQNIPCYLELNSIQELIQFLGESAQKRSARWQRNMAPLLRLNAAEIYPVLVQHLSVIDTIEEGDSVLLEKLLPQLSAEFGKNQYLRALPLIGVDTKFLEHHATLISDLLDAIHQGAITQAGGLTAWLGCYENPKGWLSIRPLCDTAQQKMGGFKLLKLSANELITHELPAANIIVVENMQSGLALPKLPNTIAVFGGGKNVQWLKAGWLKNKNLAYWGDIDTWGLGILSDVRKQQKQVKPLMMNLETFTKFEQRAVEERQSLSKIPSHLSPEETQLFNTLRSKNKHASRLEQERLSMDYIIEALERWVLDIG